VLAADEIRELARSYRRDKAHRAASPRVAEVKRRLAAAETALRKAAEDLGALTRSELDLVDTDHGEVTQALDTLDGWAARVAGGVRVGADHAAVEHVSLPARLRRHRPQSVDDPAPDAGRGPALEPAPSRAPVHQLGRQVAPRRAGPRQPEDGLEEAAMVEGGPPGPGFLGRQQRREARPHRLVQHGPYRHPVQVRSAHDRTTPLVTRPSSNDVLATPAFGEHRHGHRGEAEGVVELAVGEQAGVGGDPGPVELELEAAVERDPKGFFRFTRRVRHPAPVRPLLCV
jgi:hypothetical protein